MIGGMKTLLATAIGLTGLAAASTYDPHRVNAPVVPYALEPLQWGSVSPAGWVRDWALAARDGAGSPTRGPFATLTVNGQSVNGWKDGRPDFGGFWDEDSAYWIDGMTRLALVLNDAELLARVKEDYDHVLANPYDFHNTFKGDVVEGWVRSIYSRGMLAYFDGTGDQRIIDFLATAYANYTAPDSVCKMVDGVCDEEHQGSRSLTQMEALLEGHAYGGPLAMKQLGVQLMGPTAANGGYAFLQTLLSGCVTNRTNIEVDGGCEQHAHGVTFNEVAKLFAMAYSWTGNASHLAASVGAYAMVEAFDVQPHGVNSADEDMNGISPNIATETCDVSDFIYSNSWMLRITGDGAYGDALERAFHNAAPGAVNRTFDGHVYFQAPNFAPINAQSGNPTVIEKYMEEYYHSPPCCTGNQVRMLPNYIHHSWFGADGGLACSMYTSSTVNVTLGNTRVLVSSVTDYPFSSTVEFTISIPSQPSSGFEFPFLLRIPGWLAKTDKSLSVQINGQAARWTPDALRKAFVRLQRAWKDSDTITVNIPLDVRATQGVTINNGWLNQTSPNPPDTLNGQTEPPLLGGGHSNVTADLPFCIVERGPLLFALPLETTKTPIPPNVTCGVPVPNADKATGKMIRQINSSTRETCCAACTKEPGCAAWVRQPSTGDCFLCRDAYGTRPASDRETYVMPTPTSVSHFGYALQCDTSTMRVTAASELPRPFDWPLDAPLRIEATAVKFNWTTGPWLLPETPVARGGRDLLNITLIPYGCSKVYHVSMFPVLD